MLSCRDTLKYLYVGLQQYMNMKESEVYLSHSVDRLLYCYTLS